MKNLKIEKRLAAIGLLPLLVMLWCQACSSNESKPDAGTDGDGFVFDAGPDAEDAGDEVVDGGDQTPDNRPRALLLDQALRHRSTWIELIDALENNGIKVEYRRYYPHLTLTDVTPVEQELPYLMVIMAAGDVPWVPGSLMRPADIDNLETYLGNGGLVLLAPHASQRDTRSGDNDWFLMNRLLERLDVGIRIDKNTIFGIAWVGDPEPPYVDTERGYASTLDFQIGYPYFQVSGGHPAFQGVTRVAGGRVPSLLVSGDQVAVLLRTYDTGFYSETYGWINYITREMPISALAPAREGIVAVLGRGMLTSLGATSGGITDKPAHDHGIIEDNRKFLDQLAAYLMELASGQTIFGPFPPEVDDVLFSVQAPGYPPLGPPPILEVTTDITTRQVADRPPDGDLTEDPPADPAQAPAVPDWMSPGGTRIGYGDSIGAAGMTICFEETVTHGLDALLTNSQPERIFDPNNTPDQTQWRIDIHIEHAGLAAAAGARWIASGYFAGSIHGENYGDYPRMVGAQGQSPIAPAPVDPKLWNDFMIPTYQKIGELARDNPGFFGLSFDMELYQGPLYHTDGFAFADTTTETAVAGFPQVIADAVLGMEPKNRFEYLVDIGMLKDYYTALEAAAFELGKRCREAAHQNSPDLQLFVYNLVYPDSWFLRGFLRGLGTQELPVVALSYASWGKRATEVLNQEGIAVLHLGGTLVGRFTPADFESTLVSLAAQSHGYWFLSMKDFSLSNPDPTSIHGEKSEYWDAVDRANQTLNP